MTETPKPLILNTNTVGLTVILTVVFNCIVMERYFNMPNPYSQVLSICSIQGDPKLFQDFEYD